MRPRRKIGAIFIDEAHLVYAWGADFRSDYQSLAAMIYELNSVAPDGKKPKIICLSATVDQESLQTLDTLFSPHKTISVISSARLRPEPDIWVAPIAYTLYERKKRVLEALKHLPRPAILYVTTRKDAEQWKSIIRSEGCVCFDMIQGGTNDSIREKVINNWKSGTLDLVVGTSAFGLGINYLHARSIIHACVPESLNRYYQEIGRSGRDNQSCISLVLPEISDFNTAGRLAKMTIISNKLGFARWKSMFHNKTNINHETNTILINLSVAPVYEPYMKGQAHEIWNVRVLNLMTLSGLIRLVGMYYDSNLNQTFVKVDIIDDDHLNKKKWDNKIESTRKSIINSSQLGFKMMKEFIKHKSCPSYLFKQMYTLNHSNQIINVSKACGGCRYCRIKQKHGWYSSNHKASKPVWNIGYVSESIKEYFKTGNNFFVWSYQALTTPRGKRHLDEIFINLWNNSIHKLFVIGDFHES